jgi:tRNA-modifying protein YgfZ
VRSGAGLVDRSYAGRLLITGADRRSYLQGLLTNDIEALTPGTGCYAALLTAQGRMIADMRVEELGDAILLDVPVGLAADIGAHLDRFVFSEDVQVQDVTAERAEVGLYGPASAAIVSRVLQPARDLEDQPVFANTTGTFEGSAVLIVRSDEAGVLGYDVILAAERAVPLSRALEAAGAAPVDPPSAETVRIEAGRPRFGVDMDTDTIPLEAGIEDRAISRSKGCYVGQEVIVRVLDRGHGRVARRLVGLSFTADVPAAGSKLFAGEREVGRVTSAAYSPALGHAIALGYVQRDFTSPGTIVTLESGANATVTALPFL